MPIVDISGLSASEAEARARIRKRIQEFYHERLGMPLDATTVTFITDETSGPGAHVMARLYSKKFMTMNQAELNEIGDTIVTILEGEAGHAFNEAFPMGLIYILIPVHSWGNPVLYPPFNPVY
jgi:hypothetical protein